MDSRVAIEGWAASEVEEAKSLVSSINARGSNNNGDGGSSAGDGGEGNKKTTHSCIVKELQEWFPWKTMHEVMNLYIKLVMESRMVPVHSHSKSNAESSICNVDGYMSTNLVNGNYGGLLQEEAAMVNNDGLQLFDFPLEEMMETGKRTNQENEVRVEMRRKEIPFMNRKEVEVSKILMNHHPRRPSKRVAWTEEEHRLFLRGLSVYGRGDWKNISKHFVTTRTPVQVSSHAQKYFLKMETEGKAAAGDGAPPAVDPAPAAKRRRRYRTGDGQQAAAAAAGRANWMTNVDLITRAFTLSGFNGNVPFPALPPNNPFMQSLGKVWSPPTTELHRHPASQVVVPSSAPGGEASSSTSPVPGGEASSSSSSSVAAAGDHLGVGAPFPEQWMNCMD